MANVALIIGATVVFANVALTIGATVVVAVLMALAQSGNVFKSGYTTAPHVGKVTQTTINVKMVGPIPAMHCNYNRKLGLFG